MIHIFGFFTKNKTKRNEKQNKQNKTNKQKQKQNKTKNADGRQYRWFPSFYPRIALSIYRCHSNNRSSFSFQVVRKKPWIRCF